MANCLRVPMQVPHKLKCHFQCCGYVTWNKIRTVRKKAQERSLVARPPLRDLKDLTRLNEGQRNEQYRYFDSLGQKAIKPYLTLLKDLTQGIPEPPTSWKFKAGWTCYKGGDCFEVGFPREDAIVFDVEVCVQKGFYPTIAAAVSQKAWYLWVSPRLVEHTQECSTTLSPEDLIPLGNSPRPRIVVGHFISYDRARIRENYSMTQLGVRYFDTLSVHTCVNGVTSTQRNLMFSSSYDKEKWRQLTSPNSLEKISEFYCGVTLNKTNRDVFVKGTLDDISKDFQLLSTYCAEDVIATHKVLCKLLPLFLERQPHPLTLAGMLELSTPFMPVRKSWVKTLEAVESTAGELKEHQYRLMKSRADKIRPLVENEQFRQDPWMWDQDWKWQRWNGGLYPRWYKAFCMGCLKGLEEADGASIVYAGLTVPKILSLRCGPYPLHYINGLGWGVIVPRDQFVGDINTYLEDDMPVVPTQQINQLCKEAIVDMRVPQFSSVSSIMELIEHDLYWRESSSTTPSNPDDSAGNVHELLIGNGCVFRRLLNVGGIRPVRNPLGITMAKSMTSFNSPEPEGETFLEIRDKLSTWLSNGSHWKAQSVVWGKTSGFVLPMIQVCTDYSRLPKDRAWSSLVSLDDNQLGAELLQEVKAPRTHRFLTVTIDNMDLCLAALFSDSVEGSLASTKFSSLFMSGTLFDEMASTLNTTPEEAKCLCHAVVAGADAFTLSKFIYQAHVNISRDEAFQRACLFMSLLVDYKLVSASPSDSWPNITTDELRTPLLGARLSRPLELEKNRVRLRAQWMIHSSKVDFLHLLVASNRVLRPADRLCFVHGDNMSLYFLVRSYEIEECKTVLNLLYQKAQMLFMSRLGLPPSLNNYFPPLVVTLNNALRH